MGTITGTQIINKAAIQLLDTSNTRWTRPELLGWLNSGQRQCVLIQPNSHADTAVMQLAAGTRQKLPPDGWTLLDVYRNMGTNGTTPGRVIRIVSRQVLDAFNPNWHTTTAASVVQNYIYDIEDQKAFYVYPPADGTGWVELNYAQIPVDLASETNVITLDDVLEPTLIDYVLYRANAKDAEYAPGVQLAQMYWAAFTQALGARDKAQMEDNVNQTLAPRNQQAPGAES